jgi:U3 small nucleolar RNA-associated protein 25
VGGVLSVDEGLTDPVARNLIVHGWRRLQCMPGAKTNKVMFIIPADNDIRQRDDSDSPGSASGADAAEDEELSDNSSVDEDEPTARTLQPYASLMRSLLATSEPPKKRRRTEAKRTGPETVGVDDGKDAIHEDIDFVDEIDDAAADIADHVSDEEDDDADVLDAFQTHFADPDEALVSNRLKVIKLLQWKQGKAVISDARVVFSVPSDSNGQEVAFPRPISGPAVLNLKRRIADTARSMQPTFDSTESLIATFLFGYQDLLFCDRKLSNAESLRRLASLHAVNHVFKTRDRVLKNNARLAHNEHDPDLELRDQGFTRPKVLFLLPTRQSCVKMVDMICAICEPDQQENRKRFDDEYVDKTDNFSADRPADFRELFGGNHSDMFRIGLKFTRKTIKFYSQFYNSDILFASPLGLRLAISSDEEKDKKIDFDFLSSIELVVLDQADALLMQNWEHVEYIIEHLNLQPKESHGCDFSRVRSWYLDGDSRYFRQTVVLSGFNTPELTELYRLHCNNWGGKARIQPEYPGVIQALHSIKVKQTFSRFDLASAADDPETRFTFFKSTVVPMLIKRAKDSAGTLIFIPSYLDFVRIRNYFANDVTVSGLSFGTISDYADDPEASRARSHFMNGRHKVLLYTERAHHFRRYRIRGVRKVIMYGLPDNPLFYQEIVGGYLGNSEQSLLLELGQGSVRILFSRYDVLKLERVVGSKRVGKMIRDRGDIFEFL